MIYVLNEILSLTLDVSENLTPLHTLEQYLVVRKTARTVLSGIGILLSTLEMIPIASCYQFDYQLSPNQKVLHKMTLSENHREYTRISQFSTHVWFQECRVPRDCTQNWVFVYTKLQYPGYIAFIRCYKCTSQNG